MDQEIGKCSKCDGPVMAFVGVWGSILPPPLPKCANCGAYPKANVIEMA